MIQTNEVYDLAILGGGAAGLSLGLSIAEQKISNHKCIILEKREEYTDDKTWAFWEFPGYPSYIYNLIRCRWHLWEISNTIQTWEMNSISHPYCAISAKNFYQYAKETIRLSDRINLNINCDVLEIKKNETIFEVKTSQGVILANKIIDTTPTKETNFPQHAMFQVFFGIEFKLKKESKVLLNKKTANLMKSLRNTKDGLAFHYILPYDDKTALFEYTLFSPTILRPESLQLECEKQLTQFLREENYTNLREEYGLLPMAVSKQGQHQKHVVTGGARGGAIRAASGYGFANIQFGAKESAKRLSQGKEIKPFNQKKIILFFTAVMSKQFIRDLQAPPQ